LGDGTDVTGLTLSSQLLDPRSSDAWIIHLNKATTELALNDVDGSLKDIELARTLRGQPDPLLFANKGIALERKALYG
jgi:hypothetical protein